MAVGSITKLPEHTPHMMIKSQDMFPLLGNPAVAFSKYCKNLKVFQYLHKFTNHCLPGNHFQISVTNLGA